MITKPIVFFQQGNTFSTPWDDATNTWNTDADHHGFWTTAGDAQSYLYQFDQQTSKVLFKKNESHVKDDDPFIFTRPFLKPENSLNGDFTKASNLHWALDWLNYNKGKSIGYGTFIKPNVDLIKDGVFYTRDPWMGGHVRDAMTNVWYTTDETPEVNVITWFYAYKLDDVPIYMIIFNPSVLSLASDIEFETEDYRFRKMDPHMMDMGTQLLKPLMSRNAFPIEDKWYVVKGEEFEFDVGGWSLPRLVYNEDYPSDSIKVQSDLDITHIEKTKYKARFKKGQQSSYLSFRMNTGNTMDWTFINSGNRLVYNIKITKHYEEE